MFLDTHENQIKSFKEIPVSLKRSRAFNLSIAFACSSLMALRQYLYELFTVCASRAAKP